MLNFKDIKKFTSIGNYQVDIPLKHFHKTFTGYIEEDGLQICPDFQRGHVWNEKQQIAYVEFIIKGGTTGRVFYLNHPNWMGNFKGDFVLVDGLQRYTALTKFLNNQLPVFGDNFFKDITPSFFVNDVYFKININNLKTRKEVLSWYVEMNSGGVVHTEEEINRVIDLMNNCNE